MYYPPVSDCNKALVCVNARVATRASWCPALRHLPLGGPPPWPVRGSGMLGLGDAKGRLSGGDVIVTWHVAATSAPRSSHAALLQPTVQQLHGDKRVAHRPSIAAGIDCGRSAALDVRARSARLFAMCPAPCGRRRVSTCVSKVPLLVELPRHWRQRASAARVHQGQ